MGIQNWTVIAQSTKSAAAREIYLLDANHRNHKRTEAILNVYGNKEQTLNIIRNTERHKLKTAEKRRGGRPPSEGCEFVLAFPKSIRPTDQQWREIFRRIIPTIANSCDVRKSDLKHICRAVVHKQQQDGRKGSGDHLHLLLGKFTNKGQYLRKLQHRSTLKQIKQSFNLAALEVLGINNETYQAEQTYHSKKRAPHWQVMAARAYEEVEARAQNLERSEDEKRELLRVMNRLYVQSEKLVEAYDQGDKKQLNRQANRVSKSLEDLEDFKLKGEEFTDEVEELNKSLQEASKRLKKPLRVKPLAP